MAEYAGVIIDISIDKLDRVFHYRIPGRLQGRIEPGMCVLVPFGSGNRVWQAYVIEVTDQIDFDSSKVKELIRIDPDSNQIAADLIRLADWLRSEYGGTMNQALRTVIPVRKKTSSREKRFVFLKVDEEQAQAECAEFDRKHQTARARLLRAVFEQKKVPYELLTKKLHVTSSVIRALTERGLIGVETVRDWRNPLEGMKKTKKTPELNDVQRKITDDIWRRSRSQDLRPSLIFGVTGSGKTEVYMELIARTVQEGRQAIVLIPEISLTYQTVLRFYSRFGSRVSILNSRMSAGERSDQFERARSGELDVIIGPRSAVFTPFPDPGIIIIDEEHETAYKNENVPRYHARETAIQRMKMQKGFVVLGSATPSVESFCRAEEGEYQLYEMSKRVQQRGLPAVYIEDLRQELRSGNRSIFSRRLRDLIEERLKRQEQTMLFLNRRGVAGIISCRSCGEVIRCPHCDVSLSLHGSSELVCHYCGYRRKMPDRCPTCGSPMIGGFRAGTQKVESLVRREFPNARVLRMDYDTTRKKNGYEQILSSFANHEADILVGTQMIVKGHDFPNVTLMGILAADQSLAMPDFHASERTFQLLTQAAGRTGRGERPGEVVIQTYQPDHYSIRCAAQQDYRGFFDQEMTFRRLMHYPPAWSMLAVHVESPQKDLADQQIQMIADQAVRVFADLNRQTFQMIGPAAAAVPKVRDQYRRNLFLKSPDRERLLHGKNEIEQWAAGGGQLENVQIVFDTDPVNDF